MLIVACGTSSHAGLVARHWIEGLAGILCNVEVASEYRYRPSVPNPKQLIVAISASFCFASFVHASSARSRAWTPAIRRDRRSAISGGTLDLLGGFIRPRGRDIAFEKTAKKLTPFNQEVLSVRDQAATEM